MVTFKIMGTFVPKTSKEVKNSESVIITGHIEANGIALLHNVKKILTKEQAQATAELVSDKESVYVIKIEPKAYTDTDTGEVILYNSIIIVEQKEI